MVITVAGVPKSLDELAESAYLFQAQRYEDIQAQSVSFPLTYKRQSIPPFSVLPEGSQEVWRGTVRAVLEPLGIEV
jgi:hypothetical protein